MLWVIVSLGVAILSGLGVGSAGLFVFFLTTVEALPQLTAQGINLFFFLFSSGAALVVHLLRTPPLFAALLFLLPGGILGSFWGAALATALPDGVLRQLFGTMLIASGALGLFKKRRS